MLLLLVIFFGFVPWSTEVHASDSDSDTNNQYAETLQVQTQVYAMAPLYVENIDSFKEDLVSAKKNGVTGIMVDVWEGLIQQDDPNTYNWSYYDSIFKVIKDSGLKIGVEDSCHACGGGLGDTYNISLPGYLLRELPTIANGLDGRYHSEANNISTEVVSAHATSYGLPYRVKFWKAFQKHFESYASSIDMIIIGMLGSGELAHPVYRENFKAAFFPNRGSLQVSSPLAQNGLRNFLRDKYKTIDKLNLAWDRNYRQFSEIVLLTSTEEVETFYNANLQYSQMGQDFFDWNRKTLVDSFLSLAVGATDVFQVVTSAFQKAKLAFKIPGIYWGFPERLPELSAGLISTNGSLLDPSLTGFQRQPSNWVREHGFGYRELFEQTFVRIRKERPNSRWIGFFTAGELDSLDIHSRGYGLTCSIGALADEYQVPFFLENAEAKHLWQQFAFEVLYQHLNNFKSFSGVSFLRLSDVVRSDFAKRFIAHLPKKEVQKSCADWMLLYGGN